MQRPLPTDVGAPPIECIIAVKSTAPGAGRGLLAYGATAAPRPIASNLVTSVRPGNAGICRLRLSSSYAREFP